MTLLETIRANIATELTKRGAAQADLDAVIAAAEARDDNTLTEAEESKLVEARATRTASDEAIADMRKREADLADDEARSKAAADLAGKYEPAAKKAPAGGAAVRSEPLTYTRESSRAGVSYFRDLHSAEMRNDAAAFGRLNRHAAEMDVEFPKIIEKLEGRAQAQLQQVDSDAFFERRTNPNRTDGTGGYFVPPVWFVDQYIAYLRAGRPFANTLNGMELPEGTDSINIPKLATGTATAPQTADAASVQSTDFTDTSVSAGVKTIAGQQDISLQLLEQSPGQIIDQVILQDLMSSYNQQVDNQCLNGSNANGQVQGIDGLSGTNAVTYTDASPTGPELFTPLAQSLSQIATLRFDVDGVVYVMHPRRWFWLAASLDTANRPLVTPTAVTMNPLGTSQGGVAQGVVGNSVLGPPVIIDANVTVTDSSTRDKAYAIKTSDSYLFEGTPRTRVLQEVLSGTLQVRFQLYNYVALLHRYAPSISVMSGTGFAAPSGF